MSNILIVEDDPALNNAYKTILETSGYVVETAFNGKEALQKLKKFKPNLILLDLLMPAMDGLGFLQKFKPKEHPDAPVLLFTNMESSPDVDTAHALGIKSVVVKSMTTPQQLIKLVNQIVAK
jgi:two-component system OmpR family response regulator